MKKVYNILLLSVLISLQVSGQCNYLVIRHSPAECGELTTIDIALSAMDSVNTDKFVSEKYYRQNVALSTGYSTLKEINSTNSIISECFKTQRFPQRDTAGKFHWVFITGFNEKEKYVYKVYGIVNCIVFLDRVIEKLSAIDPKFELVHQLKNEQEILLYDRLKCDGAY